LLVFEIRQCTQPECRLRMPIDPAVHRGAFCPRCGAPMTRVAGPYRHRQEAKAARPQRTFHVLLDNLRSVYNTGAIFRTADGVGVGHLYLCGITPNPKDHPELAKTALGAELGTAWSAHPDAVAVGQGLRAAGHRLVALETAPGSMPIFEANLTTLEGDPLVLVVGNEQAGVDPGLFDLCDLTLSIPMVGKKASLNVAVAFGVAAFWLAFSTVEFVAKDEQ
jgi:tRNA G18 (ribose-2'-O)-methylase SpoU